MSLVSAGTEEAFLRGDAREMFGRDFPIVPSTSVVGRVVGVGAAAIALHPDLTIGSRVVCRGNHSSFQLGDVLLQEFCTLPDGFSAEAALLTRLTSVAAYATKVGGIGESQSALVIGLGLVGQLLVRTLKVLNPTIKLTAVDTHASRINQALPHIEAMHSSSEPVDTTFVACSSAQAIEIALNATKDCGKVVLAGAGVGALSFDLGRHVFRRGIQIAGAHERFSLTKGRFNGLADALQLLSNPKFDVANLISEVWQLSRVQELYERRLAEKTSYTGIAIGWKSGAIDCPSEYSVT